MTKEEAKKWGLILLAYGYGDQCDVVVKEKGINTVHRADSPLSQAAACDGKEIAVRVRGNSHYRNSAFGGQVGMLIVL